MGMSITFDAAAQHQADAPMSEAANAHRFKVVGVPQKTKKPPDFSSGFLLRLSRLDLLDRLEHLENRLVGADEKTLIVFTEATTLKRVAAGAFTFCHALLQR
jgi:hypothetical protein